MKIKELLTSKEQWTQHSYARNKFDEPVMIKDSTACKWCLTGACIYCYTDIVERSNILNNLFKYLKKEYNLSVEIFNDISTFKEVKQVVDYLDI